MFAFHDLLILGVICAAIAFVCFAAYAFENARWSVGYNKFYDFALGVMSIEAAVFSPFMILAPGSVMAENAKVASAVTIAIMMIVVAIQNRALFMRR